MRLARLAVPCLTLAALAAAPLIAPAPARADQEKMEVDAGDATMEVLDATDAAGLKAAVGKMAVVSGTVESAAWSKSGKVCVIRFAGVDRDGFQAVIFERDKKDMDEAFAGDVAATLTGKTVKIRGPVQQYAGQQASQEGRPEIVVKSDSQITVEPDAEDAAQPATRPAA